MKVAVFTRYPLNGNPRGGVESVALAFCKGIGAIGNVDLHVVTFERALRQTRVESIGHATVHRLPAGRWPQMLDILCGPGKRRLKRYLEKLKPDIVHFHETYGLTIGKMPWPVVFTVHGFDHANVVAENQRHARLRSILWRVVERWGLSRHRHIISITPYVRREIERATRAEIVDIDNPIDAACFEVERQPVAGRVFFAGWISPRKNPLAVIRAVDRLLKAGHAVHAHLAGEQRDALYAGQVRQFIGDRGIEAQISLLGRLAPERMRAELSQAQVLILPSLQENAPMVISEAMAAGVPVIASNRCGMQFMVAEGQTGYLIDPDDITALADRIQRLVSDAGLNAAMSARARAVARERFHPATVAAKTVAYYQRIIDSEASAARKGP
jgi:glycosyltransferase involved in cell wall biosynthesis